jgi:hypothetical protein
MGFGMIGLQISRLDGDRLMCRSMKELLRVIAGVDEQEDLLVKILHASWSGASLELTVRISVFGGEELGEWSVRCRHLLAQRLGDETAFSLELVDEHPSLWAFRYPNASAFFHGVPTNSEACVGALYKAHEEAVGSWLSFGSGINSASQISELLRSGSGLLARGPVPLLRTYKEALIPHGVDVSIVGEHHLKFFDGVDRRSSDGEDVKALLLGNSYAVGIGWTAERTQR